jgi:hypothetical protein
VQLEPVEVERSVEEHDGQVRGYPQRVDDPLSEYGHAEQQVDERHGH